MLDQLENQVVEGLIDYSTGELIGEITSMLRETWSTPWEALSDEDLWEELLRTWCLDVSIWETDEVTDIFLEWLVDEVLMLPVEEKINDSQP